MPDRRSAGTWKPGQSGNPNGRPPVNRALTEILKRALDRTHDKTGRAYKELVAEKVSEALADGKVTFEDDKTIELDGGEWLGMVRWMYQHIDGPAKATYILEPGGFTLQKMQEIAEGDDDYTDWTPEQLTD